MFIVSKSEKCNKCYTWLRINKKNKNKKNKYFYKKSVTFVTNSALALINTRISL